MDNLLIWRCVLWGAPAVGTVLTVLANYKIERILEKQKNSNAKEVQTGDTYHITKNEYNSGNTYNISSKGQKGGFTGVINNSLEDQKKALLDKAITMMKIGTAESMIKANAIFEENKSFDITDEQLKEMLAIVKDKKYGEHRASLTGLLYYKNSPSITETFLYILSNEPDGSPLLPALIFYLTKPETKIELNKLIVPLRNNSAAPNYYMRYIQSATSIGNEALVIELLNSKELVDIVMSHFDPTQRETYREEQLVYPSYTAEKYRNTYFYKYK